MTEHKKKLTLKKTRSIPLAHTGDHNKVVIPAAARSSGRAHRGLTSKRKKKPGKAIAISVFFALLLACALFAIFKYSQQKKYEARIELLALKDARELAAEKCTEMGPIIESVEKRFGKAEAELAVAEEAALFVTGEPLRPAQRQTAAPRNAGSRGAAGAASETSGAPPAAARDVGHEVSDSRDAPAGIMSRAELDAQRQRKASGASSPPPAPEPGVAHEVADSRDAPEGIMSRAELDALRQGRADGESGRPPASRSPGGAAPRSGTAVAKAPSKPVHEIVTLGRAVLERVELIGAKLGDLQTAQRDADDLRAEAFNARFSTQAAARAAAIGKMVEDAQEQEAIVQSLLDEVVKTTEEAVAVRARVDSERKAQAEAERQRILAEEHRALIAREKERAVELNEAAMSVVIEYDFQTAVDDLNRAMQEYRTDEGKAVLRVFLDRFIRLQRLKDDLIQFINRDPFKWGWVQGRSPMDILSATETGITISGNETVDWRDVPIPQMLKMITHYADQEDRKISTRGEIYLSIAILLHGTDEAESKKYRDKAVSMADYLIDECDRLLAQ